MEAAAEHAPAQAAQGQRSEMQDTSGFRNRTLYEKYGLYKVPTTAGLDEGACLAVKNIGKPCAGKPHARFDEEGQVKPALYSTRNPQVPAERAGVRRFDVANCPAPSPNRGSPGFPACLISARAVQLDINPGVSFPDDDVLLYGDKRTQKRPRLRRAWHAPRIGYFAHPHCLHTVHAVPTDARGPVVGPALLVAADHKFPAVIPTRIKPKGSGLNS